MRKKHRIDLAEITAHGSAKICYHKDALEVWTTHSIAPISFNLSGESFHRHYVALPGSYRIPFRLDMRLRLDYPGMLLFIGGGHITFATSWQDNHRIEDLLKPTGKPNQDHGTFDNGLPLGEIVDIVIVYTRSEMQICIAGEERFYSDKQPYMKARNFAVLNDAALEIGIAVAKLSRLFLQEVIITEYGDEESMARDGFKVRVRKIYPDLPKPTYADILEQLLPDARNLLSTADARLMSLRPLRFRRSVERKNANLGGYKINYVAADCGISCAFQISGTDFTPEFGWYIVTNGKPETWHRKADYMEETLSELARCDVQQAERLFYALNDCVGCYGSRCLAKTLYTFGEQKRLSCHGRVMLRGCSDDILDMLAFFTCLNALVAGKTENGYLPPQKIYLKRSSAEQE